MKKVLIEKISNILSPGFVLEHISRFQKYLIFSAEQGAVTDSDLSRIIAELMSHDFFPQVRKKDQKIYIYVFPQLKGTEKSRVWIHILLFIATIFTTMMAGAIMVEKNFPQDFSLILSGLKYSFAVLTILTMHEMGHYFAARYHKMKVTLPYYIPLPLPGFHFGTLGAFIRIKSPIPNRRALLDTAVGGPLAGFFASLIFLIIGYWLLPDWEGIVAYIEKIHPMDGTKVGINLILGKSLLFMVFNDLIGGSRLPMNEVYHFPFIFAGWIGFLVTAINLIPIGQLDGGHILYALFGKKARFVGIFFFLLLLILNFVLIIRYFSFVWVLWIVLIFLLIGFRHPPTMQDELPLNNMKKFLGWFCLFIFILCFTPLPIYIG
jgi:membrane-associated protease RseP (regulator of RpoE activity)